MIINVDRTTAKELDSWQVNKMRTRIGSAQRASITTLFGVLRGQLGQAVFGQYFNFQARFYLI